MKILGIDYGRKRIGLAVCGALNISTPLKPLVRCNEKKDLEYFKILIEEQDIEQMVLGLPKNMDGSSGEMVKEANAFAEMLHAHFSIPVVMWDERLTSWQAERILLDSGMSRAKRKKLRDSIAACLILQNYVDAIKMKN